MNYKGKSIVIGRMPRVEGNEFKTAFVKIYGENSPLTTEGFPLHEIDFPNIEKVLLNTQIEYFLEGNDIVIENMTSVDIVQKGATITITPTKA